MIVGGATATELRKHLEFMAAWASKPRRMKMVSSYKIDRRWRYCLLCLCLFVFFGKHIDRLIFFEMFCLYSVQGIFGHLKVNQNMAERLI